MKHIKIVRNNVTNKQGYRLGNIGKRGFNLMYIFIMDGDDVIMDSKELLEVSQHLDNLNKVTQGEMQ